MTIQQIEARAANESALHDAAKRIRQILDEAGKAITLPDDRDAVEEILELVQEDE